MAKRFCSSGHNPVDEDKGRVIGKKRKMTYSKDRSGNIMNVSIT